MATTTTPSVAAVRPCYKEDCQKPSTSRCANCVLVHYCSPECQKACWPVHKHECSFFKNHLLPLRFSLDETGLETKDYTPTQWASVVNGEDHKNGYCCGYKDQPLEKVLEMWATNEPTIRVDSSLFVQVVFFLLASQTAQGQAKLVKNRVMFGFGGQMTWIALDLASTQSPMPLGWDYGLFTVGGRDNYDYLCRAYGSTAFGSWLLYNTYSKMMLGLVEAEPGEEDQSPTLFFGPSQAWEAICVNRLKKRETPVPEGLEWQFFNTVSRQQAIEAAKSAAASRSGGNKKK